MKCEDCRKELVTGDRIVQVRGVVVVGGFVAEPADWSCELCYSCWTVCERVQIDHKQKEMASGAACVIRTQGPGV